MYRFLFGILIITTTTFQALADTGSRALAHSLPIVFEPNAGRWNPQVRFSARTNDYRVFLTARGAELSSSRASDGQARVLSISLVNSNPGAEVSGMDAL